MYSFLVVYGSLFVFILGNCIEPVHCCTSNVCLNRLQSDNAESAFLNVSCQKDEIIFDIDVISGIIGFSSSECHGLSLDLLIQKLNCFWQNNCTIAFPKTGLMMLRTPNETPRCFNKQPDYVYVNSLKCFKEKSDSKILIDFCGSNDMPVETSNTTAVLAGIIRSHPGYPWDYHSVDRNCVWNISYKGNSPPYLNIHALVVDVGHPVYFTTISRHQLGTPTPLRSGQKETFGATEKIVGLKLSWQWTSRFLDNAGKGFLICYAFVEDPSVDACEQIVTDRTDSVTAVTVPPTRAPPVTAVTVPPTRALPVCTCLRRKNCKKFNKRCCSKKRKLKKKCRPKTHQHPRRNTRAGRRRRNHHSQF